ncbi:MAG TPA: hypothetical protein VNC50_19810 [Planctomycetia bacterium]|nr:hypothetical protein [Planctomycetia bacterium]
MTALALLLAALSSDPELDRIVAAHAASLARIRSGELEIITNIDHRDGAPWTERALYWFSGAAERQATENQ